MAIEWINETARAETRNPAQSAAVRQRRRTGHNLLLRLQGRSDDVLHCLTDFTVPFTNNLAEQALRMMRGHDALVSLDSERIAAVIAEAGKTDPALAHTLTRLAENYDYPAILRALEAEGG